MATCSHVGCNCPYSREELRIEGIPLNGVCTACNHPRSEHSLNVQGGQAELITVFAEQNKYKANFVKLLEEVGITGELNMTKFNKVIQKTLMSAYERVKGCSTPELAKELYSKYSMITTRTVKQYGATGVVIDGELPGAVSTHANFVRIILEGRIKVFKHPKDMNDTNQIMKISKDWQFCNLVKSKNNGQFLDGLVYYGEYGVTTFDHMYISGSVSNVYVMTVADLHRPVNATTLLDVFQQVRVALTRVHALELVIVYIKPNNLFLSADMQVHIGDFGGALLHGKCPLTEYTLEYIPQELLTQDTACYAIDWNCLVISILDMLDAKPDSTLATIKAGASAVEDSNLRNSLLEILG